MEDLRKSKCGRKQFPWVDLDLEEATGEAETKAEAKFIISRRSASVVRSSLLLKSMENSKEKLGKTLACNGNCNKGTCPGGRQPGQLKIRRMRVGHRFGNQTARL